MGRVIEEREMATRKTNWAKCKVWGEAVIAEMEGPIAGCARQLMHAVPLADRPKVIALMQKDLQAAEQRAAAPKPEETPAGGVPCAN
jgi:hypothetical protein